ncbi:DUF3267 domain-containing protein [Halalkalibacillus halophilus]|uniref:DUF3267 domain-containing protein n=1 Tax=Halalkalibacillus halophilus TaxID=392827 RepID=UPI000421E903|nr:DUF3267 domain-containing protein [Halalkalibacillus halophilus]
MTCWKSFNLTKEFGQNRLRILSVFTAILSFIILFVPFSIMFQHVEIHEPGLWKILIALFILPMLHKLAHVFPTIFTNKDVHLRWAFKYKYIPFLRLKVKSSLSKRTSIIMTLAPTVMITIPLLIGAIVFPTFYPILIILTAIHIGISLSDWLILSYFVQAPKQCVVEKSKNNYDILIQSP